VYHLNGGLQKKSETTIQYTISTSPILFISPIIYCKKSHFINKHHLNGERKKISISQIFQLIALFIKISGLNDSISQ
jgi:hypothetical protein